MTYAPFRPPPASAADTRAVLVWLLRQASLECWQSRPRPRFSVDRVAYTAAAFASIRERSAAMDRRDWLADRIRALDVVVPAGSRR